MNIKNVFTLIEMFLLSAPNSELFNFSIFFKYVAARILFQLWKKM